MPYIPLTGESNVNTRSWKFDIDGNLKGATFKGRRTATSKKGKPIAFLNFDLDGELISVLSGTVLDKVFNDSKENYVGQKFEILYLGEKEGKNGMYRDYQISLWKD